MRSASGPVAVCWPIACPLSARVDVMTVLTVDWLQEGASKLCIIPHSVVYRPHSGPNEHQICLQEEGME